MKNRFTQNITPSVLQQLHLASLARKQGACSLEFEHLENAHVLGQGSTILHTKVHFLMLIWALRTLDIKECIGQIMRVIGALTKTGLGWVPTGNTGGANISPFKTLPIDPELAEIINRAKQ